MAVGYDALGTNTTASYNTAVGYDVAGKANTTATNNVSVGAFSLALNTTGDC